MLMKNEDRIIRILETQEDCVLIVNCTQKSMPMWICRAELNSFSACEEDSLSHSLPDFESLSPEQKRCAHERYTLIAGVLPFIGDEKLRCEAISRISSSREISKQTIGNHLYHYLVYQKLSALAPKLRKQDKTLTHDEKNIRWALNKFYYTRDKNSLTSAYTQMLRHKYCNASGTLLPNHPSIHQFRYFYRKHKKLQTFYISRDGLKHYQRNHRPLLGDGIQEFAPCIGTGMLDSTICDIYLVNEAGSLIGRPILTACVDAYSGLCCGYSLSWEGGVYSLKAMLANVIADKVAWCRRFGISIDPSEWNCHQLPAVLVTDMGSEYKSVNFEQIAELGVTVVNLPSYRPELKGAVEKFFDLVQSLYKTQLKGKGVIEPDFQERGARDYRKDACLTIDDFEKILLHCILYYNSKRIVEHFPYSKAMINANVQPTSSGLWNYGLTQAGSNLISVDHDTLMLTLLPRTTGKFTRYGLQLNHLRYRNDDFTERYLKGGAAQIAYNPDDISQVWLVENGKYTAFSLVESRFKEVSLLDVDSIRDSQKALIRTAKSENRQAQINLIAHIETIAQSAKPHAHAQIQGIRKNRKNEQTKAHINLLKGGRQS